MRGTATALGMRMATLGLAALIAACTPAPAPWTPPATPGDATRGETVFWAGGCATCHASPASSAAGVPLLGGGRALPTPYGTFYAPNISPDRTHGIGGWTDRQFADAMLRGLSPDGGHYYPAFPYDSYARMTARDVNDLRAYLAGLPPVARADVLHVLRFPYDNRRMLGLWKRHYLGHGPVVDAKGDAQVARGQYLVEGPGHCGSCHTPRTALGGPDYRRWLGGADEAPNITPGSGFIAEAGADEIVDALAPAKTHAQSGSYGEEMEAVRRNLAHLSDADRRAIAAYLKAILAVPDAE